MYKNAKSPLGFIEAELNQSIYLHKHNSISPHLSTPTQTHLSCAHVLTPTLLLIVIKNDCPSPFVLHLNNTLQIKH